MGDSSPAGGEARAGRARRWLVLGLLAALVACRTPGSRIPPAGPDRASSEKGIHEVHAGDTLWSISKQHGVAVEDLRRANGLRVNDELRVGQDLRVPGAMRQHVVQPGETLWRIAKQHGSTVGAIAQANGLKDVTRLSVGQSLQVPSPPGARAASPDRAARAWTSADGRGRADPVGRFAWPVTGRITSHFGLRHNHHHDGLDICAPRGTPVYASAPGRVIHADASLHGYGKMVIIKHSDRYSTVYAHNDQLYVRVGQFVEQGERIALVGQTGHASSPHLHFEVRYDGRPRDPLAQLP
jgi:lipoprotein NlpD